MLKNFWILIFLVLFGCSNKGYDTVASIKLKNFDKKELSFYQKFSIESDGWYTISIIFHELKNDETNWRLMSLLGFSIGEDKVYIDSGAPIYTYLEIIDSDGVKIYESSKNNPTTYASGYGRAATLGKASLKKGRYKINFYARQKNPIFGITNAELTIGDLPIGK